MTRGGIFGPSYCGKTTLAMSISREYWKQRQIPSLVLDPFKHDWGPQAWVTDNPEQFLEACKKVVGALCIIDEGTLTIDRAKIFIPLFTSWRNAPYFLKTLVIGHRGGNLLPIMREQIDRLYLFRQTASALEQWKESLSSMIIPEDACKLDKYVFYQCEAFGESKKLKLAF